MGSGSRVASSASAGGKESSNIGVVLDVEPSCSISEAASVCSIVSSEVSIGSATVLTEVSTGEVSSSSWWVAVGAFSHEPHS